MVQVIITNTRLAVVVVLLLLAAAGSQEAGAADQWMTYPTSNKMISCKVLGNCETKNAGTPDPTRPGAVANPYTRGCNAISRCRG